MAFSTANYVAIGKYLGYPAATGYRDPIVAACNQITALGVDYESAVQTTLRQLDEITQQLDEARLGAGRSSQSDDQGTVQFYRGDRLAELRSAARQQVAYLSQQLNLPAYRDVFAIGGGSGQVGRR